MSRRSLVSSNSGRAQEVTFVRKCFDGVFGWSTVATLVRVGGIGAVLVCVLGFVWEFGRGTVTGCHVGVHHLVLALPVAMTVAMTFVLASRRPFPFSGRFRRFILAVSVRAWQRKARRYPPCHAQP